MISPPPRPLPLSPENEMSAEIAWIRFVLMDGANGGVLKRGGGARVPCAVCRVPFLPEDPVILKRSFGGWANQDSPELKFCRPSFELN